MQGLATHSDKLKFALQLKLDRAGSFMTDFETQSSSSVEKTGFEDVWMDDSLVANKFGM